MRPVSFLFGTAAVVLACLPSWSGDESGPVFCSGINMSLFLWRQTEGPKIYSRQSLGSYWPAWDRQHVIFPDRRVQSIVKMKFDHVRLVVHPVPLLYETNEMRVRLFGELVSVIQMLQKNKLGVVITFAFSDPDAMDLKNRIVTNDTDIANFESLLIWLAHGLESVDKIDLNRLALEFSNEPEHACSLGAINRWQRVQLKLYKRVRIESPNLWLVVTGDCWSSIDGLIHLDPTPYIQDSKVLFTIHFYEPRIIVEQGNPGDNAGFQYFDRVPFPATVQDIPAIRSRLRKNIERVLGPNTPNAIKTYDRLNQWLTDFIKQNWNRERIAGRARLASNWARTNGISSSRIYLGEYGTFWSSGKTSGIARKDRLAWLDAVNSAFAKLKIGHAIFADKGALAVLGEHDEPDIELGNLLLKDGFSTCGLGR